jgi:hypothetical protein
MKLPCCALLMLSMACEKSEGARPYGELADVGLPVPLTADLRAHERVATGGWKGSAAAPDAVDPELTAALSEHGVRADSLRSQLIARAYCDREARCHGTPGSETICREAAGEHWRGWSALDDDPCLDALLDAVSCYAQAPCGDTSACDEGVARHTALCDLFETTARL